MKKGKKQFVAVAFLFASALSLHGNPDAREQARSQLCCWLDHYGYGRVVFNEGSFPKFYLYLPDGCERGRSCWWPWDDGFAAVIVVQYHNFCFRLRYELTSEGFVKKFEIID
jgi:hypothetical protein